jgi:hypothetical protein
MKHLNPVVHQFDSQLHSLAYVRSRSPFLLTSILTCAARVFHPSLYRKLYMHNETLRKNVLSAGEKSIEIIQAILVSATWKEPQDSRIGGLIGYAIRLSMELGWHKLNRPRLMKDENMNSERNTREQRNIERTWLLLFIADRR